MTERDTPAPPQPAAAELGELTALRRLIGHILESKTPAAWYLRRWLFSRHSQADE